MIAQYYRAAELIRLAPTCAVKLTGASHSFDPPPGPARCRISDRTRLQQISVQLCIPFLLRLAACATTARACERYARDNRCVEANNFLRVLELWVRIDRRGRGRISQLEPTRPASLRALGRIISQRRRRLGCARIEAARGRISSL